MSFYNPDYLLWLIIAPILIVIYLLQTYRRNKNIKKWLGTKADFLRSSISEKKRILKIGIQILVLALLIVALARLQSPGEKIQLQNKGTYILLLIDVSNSMLAEDIKPNRLDFMKKEVSRFIDLSSGDQLALGMFANSAILAVPFTNDISVVKSYLNDLSTDHLTNQGTNFERAFQFSKEVFETIREKETDHSLKALVIASDGEDHSKKTKSAVKNLTSEQDVRIFTLSFGTQKGGVIPIKNLQGAIKEYKKSPDGKLVISHLKSQSLKQFAKWGKGSYYHSTYSGKAINQLREDINRLEKTTLEESSFVKKEEHYQWFLVLALILALIELVLSDRKYKNRKGD